LGTDYKDFYRKNARQYARVTHEFIQSQYSDVSHPGLTGDLALIQRFGELIPPHSRGLDAGCGSGARDVFFYWQAGHDIKGIDAVDENISWATILHPEIADRVSVADLTTGLEYSAGHFDFVLCNAVIQHICPETVSNVVLPEFARVLKSGGLLQLMFKVGSGIKVTYDKDYSSSREFQLYDAKEIVDQLSALHLEIIPEEQDKLGGVMYFTDTKPVTHCVLFARKTA
jgi:SAM-dependent methyltransferase